MNTKLHSLLAWIPGVGLLCLTLAIGSLTLIDFGRPSSSRAAEPAAVASQKQLDPAAWGSDHVGQPLPVYTEGGECLFCHRHQVGTTWGKNKHNRTIRDAEATEPAIVALNGNDATKALAGEVQLLMGDTRAQRFLKRAAAYGHLDLLSPRAEFSRTGRAILKEADKPHWDSETFATQCAGCHTTAVDPETHAFSAVSLDCYACHGDSPVEHANDTTLMPLAKERKDSPAAVTSICASCHVRHGKSKSSGLPYPNNFVAGDNLFKDLEVDWSVLDQTDPEKKLNPADAHVLDNIRDVVVLGKESTTCLSCHDVHAGTSAKHRELAVTKYCQHCHTASDPIRGHKNYTVHSDRCQY